MAEIELSVFSRACLNRRRIGNEALLRRELTALESERNDAGAVIDCEVFHPEPALGHDRGTPAVNSNISIHHD